MKAVPLLSVFPDEEAFAGYNQQNLPKWTAAQWALNMTSASHHDNTENPLFPYVLIIVWVQSLIF